MATEDNGSIPTTTPPLTEDAVFNLDLDLEHMRQTLNDARSKLQHLEDMNKVIGTSSDNKEHRVAIQKNIEELLSDTKELVRDCVNLSLDGGTAQDFSQRRLMNRFIGEVKELAKDFQRTSEMIERSQSDNLLSSQHMFGSDDSVEQTPRDVTVPSLQMEAERRKLKERNKAFQALVQDVTDLNSLVKDIVELRDDQEDSIVRNIQEAASHVSVGYKVIHTGVVVRRKRRRFIAIIISVVVGVVIVVVLVSLAIIVTSVCVRTEQCSK